MKRIATPLLLTAFAMLNLGVGAPHVAHANPRNSAVEPAPGKSYSWHSTHLGHKMRIAEGNVDLIMFGDTLVYRFRGHVGGKAAWDEYYGERNALNAGDACDRTQNLLWRLKDIDFRAISPKLAIILIGTRNIDDNTPIQIAEGIISVVDELRTALPKTTVLVLAILPRFRDPDHLKRKTIDRTNELAEARIHSLNDDKVRYLNLNSLFLNKDGTLREELYREDYHQLTPEGYHVWAKAIEPTVGQIMGDEKNAPEKILEKSRETAQTEAAKVLDVD